MLATTNCSFDRKRYEDSLGRASSFRFEVRVVSRSAGKAEEGGAPGWGHLPRAKRVGGGGDRR